MSTTPEGVQSAINTNVSTVETFQGLFDKGAFEPSTNQTTTIDRYAGSDQAEPKGKPDPKAKAAKAAPAEVVEKAPETEVSDAKLIDQAADEEVDEEAEPEKEAPEYANLTEYLTKAEIDPDSFLDLPVTVKVDGETRDIPLKDVIKSYQLESHVNNKSIEYSDKLRTFETEKAQVQQALAQTIQQTQTLYQMAEKAVLGEYANVDWAALKAQDPARFAAETIEYQHRINAIRGQLEQAHQARAMEAQRAQEATAKLLPQQREKMFETIPEWRDPAKFEASRKDILDYGKKLGFSDADMSNITDYRFMKVLHDAARYGSLQASQPAVLKKVRAAPQMSRPGARTQRDPKAVAYQQANERLARNPRDQDAQAAVFERFV